VLNNSVLFDNGTNLGLGTISPNIGGYGTNSRLLTIMGVSGSYGILELTSNSANADGNAIGRLDFGSDGQAAGYKAISSIASFLSGSTSTKFGADLRFYTRADNAGTGDPSERMRIITNGNVGINITSPYGKLDVGGSIALNGRPVIDNSSSELYIGGITGVSGRGIDIISLWTGNTERMRISSSGLVYINTTAGSGTLNLKAQSAGNIIRLQNINNGDGSIYGYGTSTTFNYGFNTYSVADAFYLYNSGNYDFAGSDVSDRRLKENINTIDYNATEKLMQLVPKSYNMIKHPDTKRNGFIAQEVQKILPDLITGTESEDDYLGLDYNGLLAIAVKAIQELKAEVDTLKQLVK
jgi:hypothetical protein